MTFMTLNGRNNRASILHVRRNNLRKTQNGT